MYSMGSPNYVYRPWSEARRRKASDSARAWLGIPPGHRKVCGVILTNRMAAAVEPTARMIARREGLAAAKLSLEKLLADSHMWHTPPYIKSGMRTNIDRKWMQRLTHWRSHERLLERRAQRKAKRLLKEIKREHQSELKAQKVRQKQALIEIANTTRPAALEALFAREESA